MAEPEGTNRGQFLTLSTVGLGAMIGGVIGVPATAYILAPVATRRPSSPCSWARSTSSTRRRASTRRRPPTSRTPSSRPPARASPSCTTRARAAPPGTPKTPCSLCSPTVACTSAARSPRFRQSGFSAPATAVRTTRGCTHGRPADPPARSLPVGDQKEQGAVDHAALERRLQFRRPDPLLPGQDPRPAGDASRRLGRDRREYPVSARDLQVPVPKPSPMPIPKPDAEAAHPRGRGLGRVPHRLRHAGQEVPVPQGAADRLVPHAGQFAADRLHPAGDHRHAAGDDVRPVAQRGLLSRSATSPTSRRWAG